MASQSTSPAGIARSALADTLAGVAPEAPTLCPGWDAAHLAAHVILRDRRPDVGVAGLLRAFVPLLGGWVDRQQQTLVERTPYPGLVEQVRAGPSLSPTRIAVIDDALNTGEFAVHRADVRRAVPGWRDTPNAGTTAAVDRALWSNLRTAGRLFARSVPGPLVASTPDGRRAVLRPGAGDPVDVHGTPLEITLFLFGRDAVAVVDLRGPDERVAAVRASSRKA